MPPEATPGTVAVVHDYLTQRGGAERVVLSMLEAFPAASLHTSLYRPEGTFPDFERFDVRTLALNRVPGLRSHHRWALPVLAPAFSRYEVEADVVLCSSSGWSHGVTTSGRKLVYCYSPARWLYQTDRYTEGMTLSLIAARVMRAPLVAWDQRAAATADRYLTLSTFVQEQIRQIYGVEAEVIPPPPTIDLDGPEELIPGMDAGFHLCVARLLPYKNVGAVVAAFADLPAERLVVVGTGPERSRLEGLAGPNVVFLGVVSDDQLRWLYRSCAAVIAASFEDYGLTPLEAASFGRPAAALRWGGYLDTVVEGVTGVFFDEPSAGGIAAAVRELRGKAWPPEPLRRHAERFSPQRFVERLRQVVEELAASR